MKANEFFKSMGIDGVRKFVKHNNIRSGDMLNELKRLIESHDFVENYGGLHCAKHSLKLFISSIAMGLYHGVDGANAEMEIPKLKQAIADVESCQ